jgi:hypothetical protein
MISNNLIYRYNTSPGFLFLKDIQPAAPVSDELHIWRESYSGLPRRRLGRELQHDRSFGKALEINIRSFGFLFFVFLFIINIFTRISTHYYYRYRPYSEL